MARIEMVGKLFGELTVIREDGRSNKGAIKWLCECKCGNSKTIIGDDLRSGNTRSCGCLTAKSASLRFKTHGMTDTKTYRAWEDMKKRCYVASNKRFYRYGARGIEVCDAWKNSFETFFSDMGECPEGLTLERNDNDKNYGPENCRWATIKEQMRNTSRSRVISFNGKTQCLSAWAEDTGIKADTIQARIDYKGWSIEKSLTTPPLRLRRASS